MLSLLVIAATGSPPVSAETALSDALDHENILNYILSETSDKSFYPIDEIYINLATSDADKYAAEIEYILKLTRFYGYFFNFKDNPAPGQIRIVVGDNVMNDVKAGEVQILFPKMFSMLRDDASCYLESSTDKYIRHNINAQIVVKTGDMAEVKKCVRGSMSFLTGFNVPYREFLKKNIEHVEDDMDEYYDATEMMAVAIRNKCISHFDSKLEYQACVKGELGR